MSKFASIQFYFQPSKVRVFAQTFEKYKTRLARMKIYDAEINRKFVYLIRVLICNSTKRSNDLVKLVT